MTMTKLAFLLLPLLLLAACHDSPELLGPEGLEGDAAFSHSGGEAVDLIVVLDESFAPGGATENRQRAADFASGVGLTPTHAYGAALFGFAATVPRAFLDELGRNPQVVHVEFDRRVSLPEPIPEARGGSVMSDAETLTSAGTQVVPWGIARTRARESAARGNAVPVYVLDTGIDSDHPDLQANIGEGHTVFTSTCRGNPKNCPPPPTWEDDHGHGTHVAGTIGALDDGSGVIGVAPEVTLHAVKVLDASGYGAWSGIIAGIDWVAGHNPDRPRVANMSLGGAGEKVGSCTTEGLTGSTDALHTALCNATNTGVVFVVSAGNSGGDARMHVPAAYYGAAITVSATSCRFTEVDLIEICETGSEAFATWSNWGVITDSDWSSEGSLPVAIAAPGVSVLSTQLGGGHQYRSGTSMAAPHVAGGAALILNALSGSQPADGSALIAVRSAMLGATECTETWHKVTGDPHTERFLNLRGSDPINECVEPGDPPPSPPTDLRVVETTSSRVSLAWDHVDPVGARFEIWQYTNEWAHLAYVDSATAYTAEGLSASTTYRYGVRTVTDAEVSEWSNIVSATTLPGDDSDPPVAAFTYDCGNSDTCSFFNHSTGEIETWLWDFGNSQTSTAYAPTPVTYTSDGAYIVVLQVEDVLGRNATAQTEITCRTRGNRLRCE